tara:strand:- start:410 stop:703 length:294 start_codon:yes stop_codon:yes gene_type:complete
MEIHPTFSDGVDFTPLRCSLLQLNALFISLSLELTCPGLKVLKARQGTLLQVAKAYGFKAKRKKTLYLDLLECFQDNQLVQPGSGWKGAPDGVFPND